jgi:DNA-binding response OmpR family regulator
MLLSPPPQEAFNISSTPASHPSPGPGSGPGRPVVLLVEDERDLRLVTATFLADHGHEVAEARSVREARERVAAGGVDVVVLDLGLPDGDGLALLRELRASSEVAVLVVTGRGEEPDRVVGLELGADDYLVKPFSQRELVARIAAVLRRHRAEEPPPSVLRFGPLAIDTQARAIFMLSEPVDLTRLEYELLVYLAAHPGRTFTHEELLSGVWGSSSEWQSASTVSEHVYRLRRKLGLDEARPRIATVHGIGYRFDA